MSDGREGVAFRDECSSPHCSNSCPEEIVLQVGNTAAEAWSTGTRITAALIVLLISIASVVMKVSVDHAPMQCLYKTPLSTIACSSTAFCGVSNYSGDSRSL